MHNIKQAWLQIAEWFDNPEKFPEETKYGLCVAIEFHRDIYKVINLYELRIMKERIYDYMEAHDLSPSYINFIWPASTHRNFLPIYHKYRADLARHFANEISSADSATNQQKTTT